LEAYVGAEFYNKRMFPHGCPSYQKGFVKLFKVERTKRERKAKINGHLIFQQQRWLWIHFEKLDKR